MAQITVDQVTLSRKQIEAIYAEWERRVRAEPEAWSSPEDVRASSLSDHGRESAQTFIQLACEQAAGVF